MLHHQSSLPYVSQSSPICACENEADWKKIRGRIRIKITPLLPPPRPSNYLGCQRRFPITSVIIEGPRWDTLNRVPSIVVHGARFLSRSEEAKQTSSTGFRETRLDVETHTEPRWMNAHGEKARACVHVLRIQWKEAGATSRLSTVATLTP